MSIFGGNLVAKTLKQFGVPYLFSLPGHQILSIYDACLEEELALISTRHEASIIYMAQALSVTQNAPGVALLAGGPELTNALTGIAQAYFSHTPIVVIAGANTLEKQDKGFPQDMDQLSLVRPFTKWARSCHDAHRIPEYIATAFKQAIRGRPGPAYVEIPYNVLESKVSSDEIILPDRPKKLRSSGDQVSLSILIDMLVSSKRPLAIAGSGVLWSGAAEELRVFVENTSIPLLLTSGALALPFQPKLVYGFGSPAIGRPSLQAITEADLILLLGTRINFQLGFGAPPFISPRQKIIQVDIEAEEIDTNRQIDLGILGDLKTTLAAINQMGLSQLSISQWRKRLQEKYDRFDGKLKNLGSFSQAPIHPFRLVSTLEALRSDDSMIVLDGANSILWALLGLNIHPHGGILISSMGDLQAIGAGVPQALAIKLAYPDRQVILHTGDGSFGYGFMEMETALRYGIPLVVVVHNDSGWGMTRDMQVEFFGKGHEIGNQLGIVRYDRMVAGLGGHGEFVEQEADLGPALERALNAGVASCVNVMVNPKPQSPGLKTFMLMEVMLGKQTYYDRIPQWMRKFGTIGMDERARKLMLRYIDRMMHKDMK